jgi:lipopolysaccharide exporter
MGTIMIQESWLTRLKVFKVQSVSLVVGNTTTSGSRIAFGAFLGSSIFGLIVGHLVGMACRIAVQRSGGKKLLPTNIHRVTWPELRSVASQYSDFPKFNTPAALIFTVGQNLPILLFASMYSPAVAGFYAMARQLSHAPVTIVSDSMRRVFLQKAASIVNRGGGLKKAFLLSTGGLAILGIPFLIVLMMFGQMLLTLLLGERWLVAGTYLEIIAPWLFMLWVMSPCNPVFIVLRKQRYWLYLQTIITLLRLGVFGLAFMLDAEPELTLLGFVTVTIAGNLITMASTYVLISKHARALSDNATMRDIH